MPLINNSELFFVRVFKYFDSLYIKFYFADALPCLKTYILALLLTKLIFILAHSIIS